MIMKKEKRAKHLQLICRHGKGQKGSIRGSFITIEPDANGNLSQCKLCGKRVPFAADVANKAVEAYVSAP